MDKIYYNALFKDRYSISFARLKGYDYSRNGVYFITICTKNRECFFGEIKNEKMNISEIGMIVSGEWEKTLKIRPNVFLGEWVVMPNHFHGIIIIYNDDIKSYSVETHCNASLQRYKNKFGPQFNNLSSIIRGFKGVTTKQIHLAGFRNFNWQSLFYDRIIRNYNEFYVISRYIVNNIKKWNKDNFIK